MRLWEDVRIGSHVVPRGMVTDLASVPRPLWWLFPRWGKHSRAAVLHDYLYRKQPVVKAHADLLFREQMRHDGVRLLSRWCMFLAVSWLGGGAWERRSAFGLNRELDKKTLDEAEMTQEDWDALNQWKRER